MATATARGWPEPQSEWKRVVRGFWANKLGVFGLLIIIGLVLIAILAPAIAPFPKGYGSPADISLPPSARHPFGTDDLGLDVFGQVVWGTRVSMLAGLGATGIALLIGVPLGLLAAYYRGPVDAAISGGIDLLLTIPVLPLMILMAAAFGSDIKNVVLVIGFFSFPGIARIVRAQCLSLVQQPFVEAAVAMGARDGRIISRHLLLNCMPPIVVNMVLTMARAVLSEAGLSFLGLGDPLAWSWGRIIENAHRSGGFITAWWHATFPSLAILLLVISFNFVGLALNEAMNPKLKGR